MTPLEELQAAHKRLSELRDRTSPGPWAAGYCDPGEGLFDLDAEAVGTVAELFREQDLHLIVTLHRTIDAQLTLLSAAVERWTSSFDATQQPSSGLDVPPGIYFGNPGAASSNATSHVKNELALARAINGAER